MDAIIKKFPDSRGDAAVERPTREQAEAAVEVLIRWAGDDPAREGLRETPARVAKSYEELFGGYRMDAGAVLGRTFEEVGGYDDMVLLRDIDFHSHCEHHMVPIIGKAHVAYLPSGRVLGLSKISRVVDIFARRLQTQEKMTVQIAAAIEDVLRPRGVAVVLEAEHLCMAMRGVRTKGSTTVTTSFHGVFADDREERDRVLSTIWRGA
ncbi:GTP cyclohydrolase I FolE [Aureimonas leprariae]|uniref:GTP cyclohydrolase 1 n=1 Tax=Plantimonas leprariae TaxID=2615207 RepID=A0A7V7PQS5_9HYPH|nr:GTP cyclohydrolase I FolE [Aureimonas leprariae]KAB0680772.1 GTP cyclohydrolase I FolE [Aureimonas leprariae]